MRSGRSYVRECLDGGEVKFSSRGRYGAPDTSSPDGAYLVSDSWDDFGFKTLWQLFLVKDHQVHEIGYVKIGSLRDLKALPKDFKTLSADYFSLGQGEEYYENLNKVENGSLRRSVLEGLRDVALNLDLFNEALKHRITQTSLLRSVREITVRTQLHRMALGGVRLSPYSFSYRTAEFNRDGERVTPTSLDFEVHPESSPKSNVHVIVGRNGVGKSFMLHDITTALTRPGDSAGDLDFRDTGDDRLVGQFTNVVSVAFSAFDAFEPLRDQSSRNDAVHYTYIGLKTIPKSSGSPTTIKDHIALASQFGTSLKKCVETGRLPRWQNILGFLKSDPLFAEYVDRLVELDSHSIRDQAREVFGGLSSGHKIVLLTLTKLVETVEEASLVLLDEPESHLHPPLLSAFMRALSELLESRNAAAIVVTHSPVVVQEVPSNCVYIVNQAGLGTRATRPRIETFGENVGTLTQEIFGLEVTAAGFHRTLREAVDEVVSRGGGYADVLDHFEARLGGEARALVQTMLYLAVRK